MSGTTTLGIPYLQSTDNTSALYTLSATQAAAIDALLSGTPVSTVPLVRLVQTVAQAIPTASSTGITFTTEEIDTHGFHSTSVNTSRITPNVAGYYRLSGAVFFVSSTTILDAAIFKNGTAVASGTRYKDGGTSQVQGLYCSCIQQANGSTDYFEIDGNQSTGGNLNTSISQRFSSFFECEYLRPL